MRSLHPLWFVSSIICLNLGWAQLPATAKDAAAPETPALLPPKSLLLSPTSTRQKCSSNSAK